VLFERLRFRERFGEISIPRAEHVDEGFLIVTGKVSVLYGQTVGGSWSWEILTFISTVIFSYPVTSVMLCGRNALSPTSAVRYSRHVSRKILAALRASRAADRAFVLECERSPKRRVFLESEKVLVVWVVLWVVSRGVPRVVRWGVSPLLGSVVSPSLASPSDDSCSPIPLLSSPIKPSSAQSQSPPSP
jgi:hypothetical protein